MPYDQGLGLSPKGLNLGTHLLVFFGAFSSVGRATDFYSVGRRFDPDRAHFGIVKSLSVDNIRFVLSPLQIPN